MDTDTIWFSSESTSANYYGKFFVKIKKLFGINCDHFNGKIIECNKWAQVLQVFDYVWFFLLKTQISAKKVRKKLLNEREMNRAVIKFPSRACSRSWFIDFHSLSANHFDIFVCSHYLLFPRRYCCLWKTRKTQMPTDKQWN